MNAFQRKHILNGKPWTRLQRMNHTYAILRARRAKMNEDDPRRNGIMLTRIRSLEAKIEQEDEEEAIRWKAYSNAAELSDEELQTIYGRSVNNNHQCNIGAECFTCMCGRVLADRASGKEQAFAFVEAR